MRRVDDGEEEKRKKEKIMSFIVATNVIASRPPKRRLTGTPTSCAKNIVVISVGYNTVKALSKNSCLLSRATVSTLNHCINGIKMFKSNFSANLSPPLSFIDIF